MRIAVAGTHRNGKTTLVEAAAQLHPAFSVEPEPYEQLLDSGEVFLDESDPESFLLQLRHFVGRLANTRPNDNVIFDRSPLDFAAYILASDERQLGRRTTFVERGVLEIVSEGLANLELIVFLPLRPKSDTSARRSLRRLADVHLCEIVRSNALGLLEGSQTPTVTELSGSTPRRLAGLLAALEQSAFSFA